MRIPTRLLCTILAGAVLLVGIVWLGNEVLTALGEYTNKVCIGQRFSSVEDALRGMEEQERENMDTSLDICPPYDLVHSFEYEQNTIVLFRYREDFDGAVSPDLWVRILKHNDDGTLSFDGGCADFPLCERTGNDNSYFFTNIDTSKGTRSISLLYLPWDSEKEIYVDGNKANRIPAEMDGQKFYICYAISNKDTFLTNLFTEIWERHQVEVRGGEG